MEEGWKKVQMMSRLSQIIIDEDGFVFDPSTGEMFSCNSVAMLILSLMKAGGSQCDVAKKVLDSYDISNQIADADIFDFFHHLKILKIIH